mmetsp:Transcript_20400/g.33593  ORF Transcript_20400/g.33593 Transcript_20400/m.33593 type:complete len:206 (+) Transcript_20400:305-922(+)
MSSPSLTSTALFSFTASSFLFRFLRTNHAPPTPATTKKTPASASPSIPVDESPLLLLTLLLLTGRVVYVVVFTSPIYSTCTRPFPKYLELSSLMYDSTALRKISSLRMEEALSALLTQAVIPPTICEHSEGSSVCTADVQADELLISSWGIILTAKMPDVGPSSKNRRFFCDVKDLLSHSPALRATDNSVSEAVQWTKPRASATP